MLKSDKVKVFLFFLYWFVCVALGIGWAISDCIGRTPEGYLKSEKVCQRVHAGFTKYSEHIKEAALKHNVSPLLKGSVFTWESQWRPEAHSGAGAKGLGQVLGGDELFEPRTNIMAVGNILKRLNKYYQDSLTKYVYKRQRMEHILGAYLCGKTGLWRRLARGKGFPQYSYDVLTLYRAYLNELRQYLFYGFKPRFLTVDICEFMKEIYGVTLLYTRLANSQTICPFFTDTNKNRQVIHSLSSTQKDSE